MISRRTIEGFLTSPSLYEIAVDSLCVRGSVVWHKICNYSGIPSIPLKCLLTAEIAIIKKDKVTGWRWVRVLGVNAS